MPTDTPSPLAAAVEAWQPAEAAPNPHEALGRALCKAAGIDPDAAISDAGHSAWELVAHDALRGVLSTELRDAAWRARAEAAVARCEAEDAWAAFFEPGKMGDFDEQMSLAMRRAEARRRWEEAARG